MDGDFSYSYSSKPRAVQTNRSKARDALDRTGSKPLVPNIMHDPRIPRGSVFAPQPMIPSQGGGRSHGSRDKRKKRRGATSVKHLGSSSNNSKSSASIFDPQKAPCYGFTPVSLEANLVEQTPPAPARESFSQTDEFLPRSSANQRNANTNDAFLRPKIGVDSSTQIEESDRLFNFDVEVKPLLNVLVNKTLAQALVEVKEEQEIHQLHRQHGVLQAEKLDALQADRELELKAKNAHRDKELAKQQKAEKQRREQVMREKLLAWQFARPLVSEARSQATSALRKKGVFYDPMLRDLAQWLATDIYEGADAKIHLRELSLSLLDDLIGHGLRRQAIFAKLLPNESEAMVRLLLRDPIELPLPADSEEGAEPPSLSVIGPLVLSRYDSLEAIESKIEAWVEENVGSPVSVPTGGFLSILNLTKTI